MNQGTDSTLEPAYFANPRRGDISEEQYNELKQLIVDLQAEVDGTEDQEYKDGLIYKVEQLQRIVDELVIISDIKVYYDTVENWNSQPDLLSERGSIYIYSNAKTYKGVALPRIKIGTGNAYLIDLYYIDQDTVDRLDEIVTVTQEEKDRWNNKVTFYLNESDGENLVFSKD